MKPAVVVQLTMKGTNEGGRHGPFSEGYSPHIVPEETDEWLGVRAVSCPGPVAPGDRAEVVFELLYDGRVDYSRLVPGTRFRLMEGPRAVGEGTVVHRTERSP